MVGSALLRRHIGRLLAALRLEAGYSQERAAAELQRSNTTIHRMEAGDPRVKFRDIEIAAMCDLYKASPEDREQLLALTTETRNGAKKSWWQDYTDTALPGGFGLYVSLENDAEQIRQYEPELVPALLQTQAYAQAVISAPTGLLTTDEIARRVKVRLERQMLLSNPRPPHLVAILNEAVLRRQVGGPVVMAEQLRHLLDMSKTLGVTIRVVPFSVGVHGGMTSAFTILNFPTAPRSREPLEPPLVYVDSLTAALHLNKPTEVRAYELAWDDLGSQALDEEKSRTMITTALEAATHG
ncbi:helix-turn-helix domain-containing protein [Micromonospora sp. NPDC048063]|uniref:helix-turn-helix domain-containing protein n=1 Tax=Micromonospora sp. NPDC048063 TaxID=3364256 RepID=UPI003718E812